MGLNLFGSSNKTVEGDTTNVYDQSQEITTNTLEGEGNIVGEGNTVTINTVDSNLAQVGADMLSNVSSDIGNTLSEISTDNSTMATHVARYATEAAVDMQQANVDLAQNLGESAMGLADSTTNEMRLLSEMALGENSAISSESIKTTNSALEFLGGEAFSPANSAVSNVTDTANLAIEANSNTVESFGSMLFSGFEGFTNNIGAYNEHVINANLQSQQAASDLQYDLAVINQETSDNALEKMINTSKSAMQMAESVTRSDGTIVAQTNAKMFMVIAGVVGAALIGVAYMKR